MGAAPWALGALGGAAFGAALGLWGRAWDGRGGRGGPPAAPAAPSRLAEIAAAPWLNNSQPRGWISNPPSKP